MKVYPAFYTAKDKRLYIKQFRLWKIKWIYNTIVFHLEDAVVMYGIYNSDTLETLIHTVHRLHNQTTWNEKLFAGKDRRLVLLVLVRKRSRALCNKLIAILTMARKKHITMSKRFIN